MSGSVFVFKAGVKEFESLCEQMETQDVDFVVRVDINQNKTLLVDDLIIAHLVGEESHIYLNI
ncbi:hypothetical protein EVB32_060 [Rhizobium phage RHph_TM39]|uniref:Uncharacterized protein n=2 Tax=Cuauhnahuacvirus TaxID=3044696 RepID=A0A7S5RBU8_9CAUD|nr:hypothetical protein PQC16_gp060 [Rhizobium phage RHph_TM30]YP_010671207.1 hypothetical protein PQC17_gp058 [Rhizobium phage RHph_Y65]QIG71894.1 hypothetical protein EVB95_060 [Rhizobium phage RHph_TM2_3B]QIG77048.1 hypothetical protein EVB32_060 [Rhizobium phage RHph_TM39]QIG77387.1 hypothetical protein EVB61_059 [Rhizobium phage RHph_TM21B]QIG77647.1 hypothetical protein EVB64_060 [Rhizobium phage RHph_TM61]QIG71167.1 hypothetical protein EVB93_060 [Rhizobium phage RHph_TM30]